MEQITKIITADSSAKTATEDQARKEVLKIRKKGERGFTLIELLFALAVMSAIAVTGGGQAFHPSDAGHQSSIQWSGSGRK